MRPDNRRTSLAKPHGRVLSAGLAMIGLAVLSFVSGAAVTFFQVPSFAFLSKAFFAASIWFEDQTTRPPSPSLPATSSRESGADRTASATVDRPGKTFDGFTLYAHTALADKKELATEAHLIDMRRQVVHRWSVPFSKVFPNPTHLRSRVPDEFACFFDCRLLPNGDLLAVFHALSIAGCGLARLDKDSNVLWAYPAGVHHDIDVGEDGHIYAIQREEAYELPVDLERLAPPCKLDYLVVLSADGELLRGPISVLNAFRGTAYEVLLATLETPSTQFVLPADSTAPRMDYQATTTDPLHTNCVRVLNSALAGRFPQFRAGDVLLSLRNLSVIAMLNLETGKIVWAARGPWYAQHDAQFLDNGHLLLFDNLGVPQKSRVLEYDPRTQAFPWSYSGEGGGTFFTSERGMCQRLPNGNTLIVVSESGELIEVTQDKEVVWSCSAGGSVSTARRYAADQLPFLSGDQRARP